MESFWFVVISVVVAAAIGGLTNHLAIKMLFHPRKTLYIGSWKVPFTPGLIPKRKEEIGRSLGQVVGEYLVTTAGLKRVLTEPVFKQRITDKLMLALTTWSQREGTMREWLYELCGEERVMEIKGSILHGLEEAAEQGVTWLWESKGMKERAIGSLVPGWTDAKREDLVSRATSYVILSLQEELQTANGDRIVRQLAAQMMDQAGGFLGALAGIFMDEQKVSAKIRQIAIERLGSPSIRAAIEEMIRKRLVAWEQMTLENVVDRLAEENGSAWIVDRIKSSIRESGWMDSLLDTEIATLSKPIDWVKQRIPSTISTMLKLLHDQLERIIQALDLPRMVEQQVSEFPVERLEHIVLSVSGKEFRAITWLGAFLGGMIGLFQSMVLQFYL